MTGWVPCRPARWLPGCWPWASPTCGSTKRSRAATPAPRTTGRRQRCRPAASTSCGRPWPAGPGESPAVRSPAHAGRCRPAGRSARPLLAGGLPRHPVGRVPGGAGTGGQAAPVDAAAGGSAGGEPLGSVRRRHGSGVRRRPARAEATAGVEPPAADRRTVGAVPAGLAPGPGSWWPAAAGCAWHRCRKSVGGLGKQPGPSASTGTSASAPMGRRTWFRNGKTSPK